MNGRQQKPLLAVLPSQHGSHNVDQLQVLMSMANELLPCPMVVPQSFSD